jgi:uncharacterized membrane protein YgcG
VATRRESVCATYPLEIGLSSDALFDDLEQLSAVQVQAPMLTCPPPPSCGDKANLAGGAVTTTATSTGVTVIAQKVVGPYETVQLSSKDPNALGAWLADHGYAVPADVTPVVSAYVKDGFDFLALKLVPGVGVDSMRPVRITSPGAGAVLPLRMVAAGTGATTSITLWVLGEGRYEPANAPAFLIKADDIVWDWDTKSSNYAALKQAKLDASGGTAWLVEAGEPATTYGIQAPLAYLVQADPVGSGYGDGDPKAAHDELAADLDKLYGTIDDQSPWMTRLHGELSRKALGADLQLAAVNDQSRVERTLVAGQTKGTPPACPSFPPCPGDSGGAGGSSGAGGGASAKQGGGGCAVGGSGGAGGALLLAGVAVAALAAGRRRRG